MHLGSAASRAATLLVKRPGLFGRVMFAKLNTARRLPRLPASKRINGVVFEYTLERYRGTAPMYFGSYAPLVIEAMRRFLKRGDIFIDVGASIGYLSAIGAGLVGCGGQVHCFEPAPPYFERLKRLAELNPGHRIVPNACAAGEKAGRCRIYITREAGQNTMVPAYQPAMEITSSLEVPVARLDSYIEQRGLERVALIKIDAEGYEFPALRGLQGFFERTERLPAIICEIAPRAYPLTGKRPTDLADYMSDYGYGAFDLIDGSTPADLSEIDQVEDILFLPRRAF
ncbi:MAG TPA: FkbM family methyltransferase [Candidatus Sulfotelmatobacter sp.]|nr:FkbM family methyltransferase [Candidatus Sulfotelmatobacter sp.]